MSRAMSELRKNRMSIGETTKPTTEDGHVTPHDEVGERADEVVEGGAAEHNPFMPDLNAARAESNPLAGRLAELEAERDQLKDQILRALAETENVRKRSDRRIQEERVYAVEKFARDVLAISDQLGRALEALPAEKRSGLPQDVLTLLEGVELTQNELHGVMSRHGVRAIEAAPGSEFNPALHQAVSQIPSDHPEGRVAMLFQEGWMIGDRTLRAAMVAVSGGKAN
ncbi:nucleotide exchange factor GrpE [bacterium]|nr:nucleotide exchange factor GrpE [bacterium]